ncbi:MAG: bifunctional diaminohydroxyphosphoribosylaminopyrimidine deaminase/5-amino-6-(5-phosphoribosylamino)uracil reductase RibD [Acidimicrobiia bacterium]|nr:bifunctional diaminohydroxyphosphoribosylaminopyrimidine deaminase/5-amino-6-(5-phosphoribosylamino)uracil reductase RibD [Acidimicrobiia bacterium]
MSRRALSDNLDEQRRAEELMRRALGLAKETQPHPNPRVGAVVVSDGSVIAEAAHRAAGEPHAEILALRAAGARATGGTVFVTLEPCSHQGRTPPCTEALISAGIAKVVVGATDPDDRVRGSGIAELQAAGIEVISGLLEDEVVAVDPGYFHHRRTGLPLVTLKLATTLDGQIAAADRTSRWITGPAAREDAHRLRAENDVVLVGAGTLRDDDPRLDVRLAGYEGRQPRPVIIAGHRPLPESASLYARDPLIFTPRQLELPHEQVVAGSNGLVDPAMVFKELGGRGYVTALVEGGSTLATNLVAGGHCDRIIFYLGAKLGLGTGIGAFAGVFGTLAAAKPLEIESVVAVGGDVRIDTKVVA